MERMWWWWWWLLLTWIPSNNKQLLQRKDASCNGRSWSHVCARPGPGITTSRFHICSLDDGFNSLSGDKLHTHHTICRPGCSGTCMYGPSIIIMHFTADKSGEVEFAMFILTHNYLVIACQSCHSSIILHLYGRRMNLWPSMHHNLCIHKNMSEATLYRTIIMKWHVFSSVLEIKDQKFTGTFSFLLFRRGRCTLYFIHAVLLDLLGLAPNDNLDATLGCNKCIYRETKT